MFILNFFRELKAWIIVKKTFKKHRSEFESAGIKCDWFGHLYSVINRDVSVELGSDEDKIYLQNELSKIQYVLLNTNIADILAYELKPLDDVRVLDNGTEEFEHGYLILFTPAYNLDRQYVTPFTVTIFISSILITVCSIIISLLKYVF